MQNINSVKYVYDIHLHHDSWCMNKLECMYICVQKLLFQNGICKFDDNVCKYLFICFIAVHYEHTLCACLFIADLNCKS